MTEEKQSNGLLYAGLLAGSLLGASIGLMITPRKGEENRRYLELRARRLGRDVRHNVIVTTNSAQEFVGEKAGQVQQAVSTAADNVKTTATDVTTSARHAVETTAQNVRQATGNAADTVRQRADDVRQAAGEAVSNVRQAAGEAVSNVRQATSDVADNVKAKVDEVRGIAPGEDNAAAPEPTVIVVSDDHSHRGEYPQ